jgi:hypothetical protein
VSQAIARDEGLLQADREGRHPLYRQRDWQKQEREKKKKTKKTS